MGLGNSIEPGHVLSLTSSNQRRGAEVQAERIAEGLRLLGWRVDLVALSDSGGSPKIAAEPISRDPSLGRLSPDVVRALHRRVRGTHPDVVLANGGATLRYAAVALVGRRAAGPALVSVSIGEPEYWIRGRLHRWIQRTLLRRADLVMAVAKATGLQLIDMGVRTDRVEVVHSGVPESLLEIPISLPHHGLRLLFMGSLSAEKNPTAALEAFTRLDQEVAPLLRFAGAGPFQETLEEQVDEEALGEMVEFVGSVDDIGPHLAWADLLLLPSRTEGLPGSALEAAAAGIPTVAFDVGGTREAVIDGVTGRVVPAGDIEAFVSALQWLGDAEQERAEWGRAARAMVKDRFLLEHTVARYHRLLGDQLTRS